MTTRETIVVLDFGSQYSQLIARRVREAQVYCELLPWDAPRQAVDRLAPMGFILSGGPASVYESGAPTLPDYVLEMNVPVLGICYGMQLLAHNLGGRVAPSQQREYGPAEIEVTDQTTPLAADQIRRLDWFTSLGPRLSVWMSHGDRIEALPPGWTALARSDYSLYAAMGDPVRGRYGLQFHPEVHHTPQGPEIIRRFLYDVCGCHGTWTPGAFIEETVAAIRAQVEAGQVVCALSGGVDSTVTAALIHRAVGDQLTSIFVDHGLLRQGEAEQVLDVLRRQLGLKVVLVEASERFLRRLAGVVEPEEKRRIIGEEFIRVFEAEAARLGQVDFLAQGTLYPDVIESAHPERKAAGRIKTHHNVGGLPANLRFKLIEPLRYLFKDEVRAVGRALGLPDQVVQRQPFPGPGLAVRIIGAVTPERLATLRAADAIVRDEITLAGLTGEVWQYFAVLTAVQTVGVMGDGRTYQHVVAIRAVTSVDGMTADWARLPYDLLSRMSARIVNEVAGVNRVVYDITSKPPATIEWE
jgi:GMP synthase (glutamine-hydrolysing)